MNKLRSHIDDIPTQIAVLAVFFIAAYYVPLKTMANIWWEDVDYSYGFLIPIVSLYMLWDKRKTFGEIPVRSAWWLLPVLVFFILISIYGILGSSGSVSMPSVPVLIMLFAGFCFGVESVKRLILPLGFLFLMVPVPGIIDRNVGVYLKALSSRMGGSLIGLFNIPVHVSGNIIDLGAIQLQVVDACSGLRYIFPLLALGIVYAYFFERVAWKRVFCVLVTIPLAVIINVLRIGVTGILTEIFGPKVSEGFFHDFSGFVLFLFAFIILFMIGRVLAVLSPKAVSDKKPESGDHAAATAVEVKKTTRAFLISVAFLCCVAVLSFSTSTMPAMAIDGGIQSFPLRIGEWKGTPETVDPALIRESGAEEAFSGKFTDGYGDRISMYIGYRSTAFLADENFFHSPTVCIPSAGWVEQEVKRRTIENVEYFGSLDVTEMVIEKDGTRQLVYFWFQTKDKATHDKNINRFHLTLHAIRRDNTHDLFIRPITPIGPVETVERAEMRMDGFVRKMMPVLLQFVKEKQVKMKRSRS